jgi:hypothetical protein
MYLATEHDHLFTLPQIRTPTLIILLLFHSTNLNFAVQEVLLSNLRISPF